MKYGYNNFEITKIEDNLTHIEAKAREMYWIVQYDSYFINGRGYNMTTGGDGGGACSDETKLKISKANKGKRKGVRLSEYTKNLMSKIKKERDLITKYTPLTEEHKQKIREANILSWQKEERRQRGIGENASMYGKKGVLSPSSKPMEYWGYGEHREDRFIESCKRMNWNEDNFERIKVGKYKNKLCFKFIFKGDDYSWKNHMFNINLKLYEIEPIGKARFLNFCKINSLNPNNFKVTNHPEKQLYFYKFMGTDYDWEREQIISHYENIKSTHENFKRYCNKHGLLHINFKRTLVELKDDNYLYNYLFIDTEYDDSRNRCIEILTLYENKPVRRDGFKTRLSNLNKKYNSNVKFEEFREVIVPKVDKQIQTFNYFYNYHK